MTRLLELLGRVMTGDTVRKLSDQIGADLPSTGKAISATLPLLVGALARNANESQRNAQALEDALKADHDGSLLDHLNDVLGRSAGGHSLTDAGNAYAGGYTIDRCSADGEGILQHMLGRRRAAVENGISRASEVDVRKVALLTPLLAVILMSALGRIRGEDNLDADGLARLLNRERAEVEREAPEMKSGGLMDYLDGENDGDVIEEVERISSAFQGRPIQGRAVSS